MRILGWLAMALGVIGVVVFLALVPVALIGRDAVTERGNGLGVGSRNGLERATTIVGQVSVALGEAQTAVSTVQGLADQVAASPEEGPIVTALRDAVTALIGGPYARFRSGYVAVSERLSAVAEGVQRIDAALPGVSLPGALIGDLAVLDQRMTQIDDVVTAIDRALESGVLVPDVAAQLSLRAGDLGTFLVAVTDGITELEGRIENAKSRLDAASAQVGGVVTMVAIVVAIVGLYLAGLNVLLFQQGRRWARSGEGTPSTGQSGTGGTTG